MGLTSPIQGSEIIRSVLKGAKRVWGNRLAAGNKTSVRRPITASVLASLRPHLDLTTYKDVTLWAAFTMGTYALLRVGEFTVRYNPAEAHSSTREEQEATILRWRHVAWHDAEERPLSMVEGRLNGVPAGYRLTIPASKTDPFRQSVTVHVFAPTAVRALQRLAEFKVPNAPYFNDPIFVTKDNRSPITRTYLIAELRNVLRTAGFNPDEYNGHSFRKGGAKTLAEAGIRDNVIKVMGRWTSECYQRYINESKESIRAASLAMEPTLQQQRHRLSQRPSRKRVAGPPPHTRRVA